MIKLLNLSLAVAFVGVFAFGAAAQQPADPPAAAAQTAAPALPPGSPLIGRPASEAAAKLAPVAAPPIAAAVDKLPTAKLKVPPGFNIEVYAAGMANARSLAEGDKGTVFVGSRQVDKVYAIVNKDGKRTVKVLASGLYRPNGVAFHDGTLYIADTITNRIAAIPDAIFRNFSAGAGFAVRKRNIDLDSALRQTGIKKRVAISIVDLKTVDRVGEPHTEPRQCRTRGAFGTIVADHDIEGF